MYDFPHVVIFHAIASVNVSDDDDDEYEVMPRIVYAFHRHPDIPLSQPAQPRPPSMTIEERLEARRRIYFENRQIDHDASTYDDDLM
jgi:hypothetical protein